MNIINVHEVHEVRKDILNKTLTIKFQFCFAF